MDIEAYFSPFSHHLSKNLRNGLDKFISTLFHESKILWIQNQIWEQLEEQIDDFLVNLLFCPDRSFVCGCVDFCSVSQWKYGRNHGNYRIFGSDDRSYGQIDIILVQKTRLGNFYWWFEVADQSRYEMSLIWKFIICQLTYRP